MRKVNLFLCLAYTILLISCSNNDNKTPGAVYVKPSVDYKGKYRKGHVRFKVSTNKNAIKNQNKSRYYYHTRGKYRKKK
jgi:hypothetical protein